MNIAGGLFPITGGCDQLQTDGEGIEPHRLAVNDSGPSSKIARE